MSGKGMEQASPMTARIPGAAVFPSDLRTIVVACAALVAFSVAAFAHQLFNDGDTYWHVTTGEWMLDHRAILYADPFSFTFLGHPWDTQEWLAEIIMASTYRALGWSGLTVLFAAACGATGFLLALELSRWLRPLSLVVTLVLAFGCIGGGMVARPHLLTFPILVLWTAELLKARAEDRAPNWQYLPMMTLWANLHGSFIFGVALIAPFALEAGFETPERWRNVVRAWGLFLVGALIAAAITPEGFAGLLFPIKLLSMTQNRFILEWQSSTFETLTPFELGILATLYVVLSRGVRVSFFRLLLLLGMLHMALQHERYQQILAISGLLILARPLGEALDPNATAGASEQRRRAWQAGLVFILVAAVLMAIRLAAPLRRGDDTMSPATALAHVPESVKSKPVFNDYSFGGYLIFTGIRPFIDSRADMYGDPFLLRYREMTVPDRPMIEATLKQYGILWALLRPNNGAIVYFDTAPAWRRLYADKFALIYVRRDALPASKR